MIISEWEMYWITRLGGITEFAAVVCILGWIVIGLTVAACPFLVGMGDMEPETRDKALKWIRSTAIPVAVVATLVALFVPTTKEYVVIKVLPAMSRNEDMQKIPADTASFVRKQLEAWIADLGGDKKKD